MQALSHHGLLPCIYEIWKFNPQKYDVATILRGCDQMPVLSTYECNRERVRERACKKAREIERE